MNASLSHSITLAAMFLVSAGCKENPQLVKRSKEQTVEIETLKSELAALQERLKDAPSDQSKTLDLAKAEQALQASKLKELEREVHRLTSERDKAKAELDNFLKQRAR